MSWSLIQKYVDALPDDVSFDGKTLDCQVKDDQSTRLSLKAFQRLWTGLSDKETSVPTPEFLSYLRKEVSGLENAEKLAGQLNELSKTLSTTMNGVHLKVNMAESLTKLLSGIFSGQGATEDCSSTAGAPAASDHQLSVTLQIPEFNTPPDDSDELQQKINQLLIGSLPAFKWHADNADYIEKFSAKTAGPPVQLPTMEELSEAVFDGKVNDAQVLVALAVVLKCYPEKWRQNFFWDAWLAVTLQLCTLPEDDKYVFPCVWIKQVFEAERFLQDPLDVKHLLFGIDPVSKTYSYDLEILCRATGVAFHAVGNDNPSIEGMKKTYGLDCDDDNPIKHCKDGLLLVNMVRCIRENDKSLTNNSCRRAWIVYTLRIIHHFSSAPRKKPVMVLTSSSSAMTKLYVPKICEGDYVQGPHPSYEPKPYHLDEIEKVHGYLKDYK